MNFQRRNPHSLIASPIFAGALAVLFVVSAYQATHAYLNVKKIEKEKEELSRKIQERERGIKELEASLKSFESGEGLELEAKGRLNLQKPDERVLIIVGDKNTASHSGSVSSSSS